MRKILVLVAILAVPVSAQLVSDIRDRISAGDLLTAEAVVEDYRRANGATSEYAAGLGWVARGALMMHNQESAAIYLAKAKNLIGEIEKRQRVEDDDNLRSALGTTIEVDAQLLAADGKKGEAVALLQGEAERWKKLYGLNARIVKTLNLLTLVGKPAPELPAEYTGKLVLLFLWADWCMDSRAQGATITVVREKFKAQGLQVFAPTRLYKYALNFENPTPEQEKASIELVWKQFFAGLSDVPHPIDDAAMEAYGVSSTPTLVLIDRKGIVRMYQPSRMTEEALTWEIETLLAKN